LRFAGDGSLYVTNGDGANYRNPSELSQMTYDLNSLRGKILRIDPQTGLGLADNPFYDGNPSSNQSRVVSYGLRNPYSMTLHPVTGIPYVGEVGEENWEEINGGIGKNFGWPCYEGGPQGNLRQADFAPFAFCTELYASNEAIEPPLTSWQHDGQGNAGIIGDFYLGTQFPEEYRGKLFYGDYIRGWLRYADVDVPGSVTDNEFATNVPPMTEIRVGEDGALYYASVATGEIRRIRFGDEPNSQTPTPTPPPTDPPEPTEPANPSGPGVVEGGVVSGQPVTVGFGSPLLLVLLMCSGWARQKGSRRLQD
jgi:glucose/arabinose dehydrogenase